MTELERKINEFDDVRLMYVCGLLLLLEGGREGRTDGWRHGGTDAGTDVGTDGKTEGAGGYLMREEWNKGNRDSVYLITHGSAKLYEISSKFLRFIFQRA